MGKYRYDINIEERKKYGIELEFSNVDIYSLTKEILKYDLPIEFIKCHNNLKLDYHIWYLDYDASILGSLGDNPLGAELSSKILRNTGNDWQEIEQICNFLTINNAKVNEYCSTQVNIDVLYLLNNNLFWETFCKIIALIEEDINLFYMGERYFIRKTKREYAKNLNAKLLEYINNIDFEDPNFFDLMRQDKNIFGSRDGINLNYVKKSGRMEIRYPNPTIKKKIIQNYINFSLKLVESIIEGKWDIEELTYLVNEKSLNRHLNYEENKLFPFERVINTISANQEDQNDFIKQYEKVLSTRNRGKY